MRPRTYNPHNPVPESRQLGDMKPRVLKWECKQPSKDPFGAVAPAAGLTAERRQGSRASLADFSLMSHRGSLGRTVPGCREEGESREEKAVATAHFSVHLALKRGFEMWLKMRDESLSLDQILFYF